MRALVTGAGGFLGRYIAEQLVQRGDQVRAFSRQRYGPLEAIGVESLVGDIRDAGAVERACDGIDVVFHAAAIAGIWGAWNDFYQINTVGTEHILRACRNRRVPRLVYTSSPSVTFDGRDQINVDESAPYAKRWLCHYPRSKAWAEQRVLAASDDRLRSCALRPHLIWGPRDSHLVPRLIDRARSGKLRRVGDGTNLIDVVYVENAAQAHLQAADAMADSPVMGGRAYFISQGEPVNCWNWIDQLLELAGLPKVSRSISLGAAWSIGAILEAVHGMLGIEREPRMTRFLAAQLARSHYFNIDRARNDFGYRPRISMEEGMQRLAKSWVNG